VRKRIQKRETPDRKYFFINPFKTVPKGKKTNNVIRFLKEDDGVTMIEYGLIAAIIAIGVLLTLQGVRDGLITLFGKVKAALTS
jgi:pilus assembly protein Flp/PilA